MSREYQEDSVVDAFASLGKLALKKPLAFICVGGAIAFWGVPCGIAFAWNLIVVHEPFDGSKINLLMGHTVGWNVAGILSGGLAGADKEVRPALTKAVEYNPAISNFNNRANDYDRTLSGQQQNR